jgi:hypothetical protein
MNSNARLSHIVVLAGLLLAFAAMFTAVPTAAARYRWRAKCATAFQAPRSPQSCVRVAAVGANDFFASGGVRVAPRQRVIGRIEVWVPGKLFRHPMPDKQYDNTSGRSWRTFWEPPFLISNVLAPGTRICARFWEKRGNSYKGYPAVCVLVASFAAADTQEDAENVPFEE